jgi:hypothetical protein
MANHGLTKHMGELWGETGHLMVTETYGESVDHLQTSSGLGRPPPWVLYSDSRMTDGSTPKVRRARHILSLPFLFHAKDDPQSS